MGCLCHKGIRTESIRLQKPGTMVLPPLYQGTMESSDLKLVDYKKRVDDLNAQIQKLESETAAFEKSTKDPGLTSLRSENDLQCMRKTLSTVKGCVNQYRAKLRAYEQAQSGKEIDQNAYLSDHDSELKAAQMNLSTLEQNRAQFEATLVEPKRVEEVLGTQAEELIGRWQNAFEQVKNQLRSVQELQGDVAAKILNTSRSNTQIGFTSETPRTAQMMDSKLKDEVDLLETSVLFLYQVCQKQFQELHQVATKLQKVKTLQLAVDAIADESAKINKEIDRLSGNMTETEQSEVLLEELHFEDVIEEHLDRKPESAFAPETIEVLELNVDSKFDEEVLLASQPVFSETDSLPRTPGFPEPKTLSRTPILVETERLLRSPSLPESEVLSWTPSKHVFPSNEDVSTSMTQFEAFTLFESAISQAEDGFFPSEIIKTYIEKRESDRSVGTWLTSLRTDSDDQPYAKIILSLMEESEDRLSRDAALLFPGLIRSCNELVKNVESDVAADSFAYGDTSTSEEFDKTLYTGGFMYWVDCIDLIYSSLTPQLGTLVLKTLKPDSLSLPDYITFQICHKMRIRHTDGMKIFQMLDVDSSGKLDAVEFSKGLQELLELWITEADVTQTFRSLYNRWSGLVSKTQFSKQVNFTEYLQMTKGELSHLSKYTFLTAVLKGCQKILREALKKLFDFFPHDDRPKVVPDEFILSCFESAEEVTLQPDVQGLMEQWKRLVAQWGLEGRSLRYSEAKQIFIDALCK